MLFAAFWPLAAAECETPGVRMHFGETEWDADTAYCDSSALSGSHYLWFWGSFKAKGTDSYTFSIFCEPYGLFNGRNSTVHFYWDGPEVATRAGAWDWPAALAKDFRYPYALQVANSYSYVTLWFEVTPPGESKQDIGGPWSDTCTVSGCRDLSLTREAFACQPPPGSTGGFAGTGVLAAPVARVPSAFSARPAMRQREREIIQ
jgi:hypothetical protein